MTTWQHETTRAISGGVIHKYTSKKWDGVLKFELRHHGSRENDATWYEAACDKTRTEFSTPTRALERHTALSRWTPSSAT